MSNPRLSHSDVRCIAFAKVCQKHNLHPAGLAVLCAQVRRCASAIVRKETNSDGDASAYRRKVEAAAKEIGLTVSDWPSFYPRIVKDGIEVGIPFE